MTEYRKEGNKLSSEDFAVLVVDALVDAQIISKAECQRAVEIVSIEINARKGIGDY